MNLHFDQSFSMGYKSNSQKIRVMSEHWVEENMYCPNCGNLHICKLDNNKPVADFQCNNCGEIYELKSKGSNLGNKIIDGAYETVIERITSVSNPNLFILQYSSKYIVDERMIVPKFFLFQKLLKKGNLLHLMQGEQDGQAVIFYITIFRNRVKLKLSQIKKN